MKYLITLTSFVLGISFTLAQQELSLHFLNGMAASNFTNPAFVSSDRKELILPSVYYNFYTPDFKFKDLFAANLNGTRDLNELAQNTLGMRNRLALNVNATTLGLAFNANPKLRLTLSHTYNVDMAGDIDGALIKAVMNDYSKSIGKTIPIDGTLNGNFYHQLAIGGSYQYKDNIRLGARIKYLKGIVGVFTRSGQSLVTIEGNNYATSYNNNIDIVGFSLEDVEELQNVKGILKQSFNFRNMGLGLDMGATYKVQKWLFSASLIDAFSFINWRKKGRNYTGLGYGSFSGINTNISIFKSNGGSASFNLKDTLKNIVALKIYENAKYFQLIPTKIYLSAVNNLTNKLKVGGLFYLETGGDFDSQIDLMAHASYKFLKNIELGTSWSLRNKRFDNIGFQIIGQYKNLQIYGITDNVFTAFNPYNHRTANARIGANLLLKNKTILPTPPPSEGDILPKID